MSFNFNQLQSTDTKAKYSFTQELLQTSVKTPEKLYSFIDEIIDLLNHQSKVVQWAGIDLIGYLAAIDTKNTIDPLVPVLIKKFKEGKLITTNHAIFALGLIAQAKPQYKNKILKEFLKVDQIKFETEDCIDIATGKIIDALKNLVADIKQDKNTIAFIEQATDNKRGLHKKGKIPA